MTRVRPPGGGRGRPCGLCQDASGDGVTVATEVHALQGQGRLASPALDPVPPPWVNCPMLLVIDNFDSFTFNLVQYFGQLGVEQRVFRNNEITPEAALALKPDRVLLSPGP
ncbi:MAG TPA: hypothetical protein VMD31_04120, partial [Opitutaceae bacterium]|nr:hypothetical protein [Opitutaceae bacterium]